MKIQVGPVEKFADIPGMGLIEGPGDRPFYGNSCFCLHLIHSPPFKIST